MGKRSIVDDELVIQQSNVALKTPRVATAVEEKSSIECTITNNHHYQPNPSGATAES